ncbi:DNA-binding protein HU [Paraburkholderia kirstenboschensis]|uniref:HU family DNA-binding protein n=1 Tax=Paraburkholderia kirstenboschensis TaxID=1245436 RepID=UPI000A466A91|nr:HU family DNA-binding protein [Paraburkholderia kirstenboschensis]CAD6557129.1 DNA-binding protein HU [Paraburkholderia kirstenboschensis]
MNKQDLIDAVAAGSGDSRAATAELVIAVLDVIAGAISRGETMQLVGFGSFSVGQRADRICCNPATGAEVQIPAAKTVGFTAGNTFRDAAKGA